MPLWDSVFASIKNQYDSPVTQAFLRQLQFHTFEDGILRLAVPDSYTRDWVVENLHDAIRDQASQLATQPCDIEVVIDPSMKVAEEEAPRTAKSSKEFARPLVTSAMAAPLGDPLNPRYSFDSFVIGANSQFAVAGCKSVADLPGGHYNPLFIYGGVGLGKTHLLNAIGLGVQQNFPHLRILYVQGERFMNEVIYAIRFDKTVELRKKYRDSCDVLLIDDIQFIAGKERTQEEFFHTFNVLHTAQKQIVVSSDRFPKEMAGLDDRLRSRFEWGLIADIQPPDLETRVAILQKKAESSGVPLRDDVAMYLAEQFRSNVRELEGSLIRLAAYSTLNKREMSVEYAQEILKNIVKEHVPLCTIENIQKVVAEYYQIKIAEMKSPRRMKHLAVPRQIAMYLCKKLVAKASYPDIGRKFGGKDHTTVIHACRKIEGLVGSDVGLRDQIASIEKSLA